jgi:hypothetical protein
MSTYNIEQAAREISEEIIAAARTSGDESIVFVTGNSFMPPLRSFDQAEAVWQADEDGSAWEQLVWDIEERLDDAQVLLECPEYDNALYAVDLARFEYVESDGENLGDNWQVIA